MKFTRGRKKQSEDSCRLFGPEMTGLISERLKNLSFMKRREERDIRARLAAKASGSDESTLPKKSLPNKTGEMVAPLVVIENAAEIGNGDSETSSFARSGRRSFGNFNPGLEAAQRAALRRVERQQNDDVSKDENVTITAEKYSEWKKRNVNDGSRKLLSAESPGAGTTRDPLRGTKRKLVRKLDRKKKRRRKMEEKGPKKDSKKAARFVEPAI